MTVSFPRVPEIIFCFCLWSRRRGKNEGKSAAGAKQAPDQDLRRAERVGETEVERWLACVRGSAMRPICILRFLIDDR